MPMLRTSLVSTFALVIASLGAFGCATNLEESNSESAGTEGVSVEADTDSVGSLALGDLQPLPSKMIGADVLVVAPACRAVLLSTKARALPEPNDFGCASANPYIAQRRLAGYLESGLTVLVDEARPGEVRCTPSPIVGGRPLCLRPADLVVEQLCTETRVYECPCGVETVLVEGERAGQCRRLPR